MASFKNRVNVFWKLLTLIIDEEVDKFKPSRSAIKLEERAGVGRAIGTDTGLTGRKGPN